MAKTLKHLIILLLGRGFVIHVTALEDSSAGT